MREILCRGKRIDNDEWVYGSLVVLTDINRKKTFDIVDESGVGFHIDETTIGQYTELYDMHEYMIFDGDILQRKYNNGQHIETCVVKSVVGSCGLYFYFKGFNYDLDIDTERCMIIGNIYDNPELLKGE